MPDDPVFDLDNKWLVIETHKRFQEQVEAARGTRRAPRRWCPN